MSLRVYSTGLTTRFRGITRREGALIGGPAGWAEFSPFLEYDAPTALPWLRAAIEAASQPPPGAVRDSVPVNVTVPAVGPERARAIVKASGGCTTAKVKVAEPGQDVNEEAERLEAVRDALGPSGKIRVDANGGWTLDQALHSLPVLDRAASGLEYAEQPVASVEDLAAARRRLSIPIAADESIRRAADPLRVKALAAADVVVLKVQPLGGIRSCLALAEEVGLPVVVSSALETSVGIAAGVALGAALPTLEYASGLATVQLLAADVTTDSMLPDGGALAVRPVEPLPDLGGVEAPAEVAARWRSRIEEVAALLTPAERELLRDLLAS